MNDDLIEQYREIAKENPDDDLSQFAFGQALLNAKRPAEAVPVLRHVTRINPKYTRAYILLGQALEADGDEEGAIEAWQLGYHASNKQGTLMNAQEAKRLLEERNAPLTSEVVELLGLTDEDQIEGAPEDANREPNQDEVQDAVPHVGCCSPQSSSVWISMKIVAYSFNIAHTYAISLQFRKI